MVESLSSLAIKLWIRPSAKSVIWRYTPMKVFTSLTAGLLLGVATSMAQNGAAPLRWTEGAPNATSEVKNDAKIEGLKTDDVHIYVSLADLKETEYNRVWIQVANRGSSPLDF